MTIWTDFYDFASRNQTVQMRSELHEWVMRERGNKLNNKIETQFRGEKKLYFLNDRIIDCGTREFCDFGRFYFLRNILKRDISCPVISLNFLRNRDIIFVVNFRSCRFHSPRPVDVMIIDKEMSFKTTSHIEVEFKTEKRYLICDRKVLWFGNDAMGLTHDSQ